MILHIVKEGERVNNILEYYNISLEELKVNNFHITDFKNIMPGTRLKIPVLSNNLIQILDSTEPLVKDYLEEKINQSLEEESVESVTKKSLDENFKGLNIIRPKRLFNYDNRRSIYPYFDKNKDK